MTRDELDEVILDGAIVDDYDRMPDEFGIPRRHIEVTLDGDSTPFAHVDGIVILDGEAN